MAQLPASLLSGIAFASVAGLSALVVAMTAGGLGEPVRSYLRFAASLTVAAAVATLLATIVGRPLVLLASAVEDLVAALVPAALALASLTRYGRPLPVAPSTVVFALACTAGLLAAALNSPLLGFAPLLISAFVIAGLAGRCWSRRRKPALLFGIGAVAFVAAAASSISAGAEGRIGFVLFFAAGQLGIALAIARRSDLAVEGRTRGRSHAVFIRRED